MYFMKKAHSFLWVMFLLLWMLVPGRVQAGETYFPTQLSKNTLKAGSGLEREASDELAEPTLVAAAGDPPPVGNASSFISRFEQGQVSWGFQLGYGFTINLPPPPDYIGDRTDFNFLYIFPNWKFNLTGLIGKGPWQGALYWVVEGGVALGITNPKLRGQRTDDAPSYVIGLVPLQLEYKFINLDRRWVPFIFAGAGGSITDFNRGAREISTQYEFILNTGGGIEYYFDNGHAISFNYHFWHLSNSGIEEPNIGLNSHVFTMGFTF
jgi:hypothetical protein